MCQYSSPEGFATDWHLIHLGTRAVGRAGIVMLETSAIQRDGRISHWDLGIWDDDHIDMLSRIAGFVSEQGSIPAVQIGHAGRKASQHRPWEGGGPLGDDESPWVTLAPSAMPFDEGWHTPNAMTSDEIDLVVESFQQAARRAREAGFMILEVHAAHGYLLNQFLCSTSNHRKDQYGGSFNNRIRLTCEAIEAVRAEWPPEYPVFVRISATDWSVNGWGVDDSIALVNEIRQLGVDVIDVSSGGNVPGVNIPNEEGYQVPFAETIRRETGVPTVAVGHISRPEHAEAVIGEGNGDIVALGREFLRNPYWPYEAAKSLGFDLAWPEQYVRARPRAR
jgi:2,4-dienoyl-CoA reductase-like NADH-dependent reductase (Old Yellow Enzyme family)